MKVDAQDVILPLPRARIPRGDGKPPLWRLHLELAHSAPVARTHLSLHALTAWEAIGILATWTAGELYWQCGTGAGFQDAEGQEHRLAMLGTVRVLDVSEDDTGVEEGA